MDSDFEILEGGNMNQPLLKDGLVYKDKHKASHLIHELLTHVKKQGIDWVPTSHGIDENGKHVFSYIEGIVPDDEPKWLWDKNILKSAAIRLREWHEATSGLKIESNDWLLENDEPNEVICHCDFAPYNSVFRNKKIVGLIDFDVCSPGSRLWDIAYAAYRFVPLFPPKNSGTIYETSPFTIPQMLERLDSFLKYYSKGDSKFLYTREEALLKISKRVLECAIWSENYGKENNNTEMGEGSKMYREHSKWVLELLGY